MTTVASDVSAIVGFLCGRSSGPTEESNRSLGHLPLWSPLLHRSVIETHAELGEEGGTRDAQYITKHRQNVASVWWRRWR